MTTKPKNIIIRYHNYYDIHYHVMLIFNIHNLAKLYFVN